MANLQSSGAISLANIKNLFGGPASPSFANYYRGGSYIPATKSVSTLTKEPTGLQDQRYGVVPVLHDGEWYLEHMYKGVWFVRNNNTSVLWWNDVMLIDGTIGATSWTSGSYIGAATRYNKKP